MMGKRLAHAGSEFGDWRANRRRIVALLLRRIASQRPNKGNHLLAGLSLYVQAFKKEASGLGFDGEYMVEEMV